jgi:hypothetical protein
MSSVLSMRRYSTWSSISISFLLKSLVVEKPSAIVLTAC